MINLSAAGLSETEANAYQTLLTQSTWLPSKLAKTVGESRTNMYKILDKLVSLKLARKFDKDRKFHYQATNPARLIELAHLAKTEQEKAERELELQTQLLTKEYVKTHEQPGVTFYQGKREITKIFEEISKSKEEVVFVHTRAGVDFYGFNTMHELRMEAVKNNVHRRALTPDTKLATSDYKESDPLVKLTRTWLKQADYKSPVEWGAFDDKLYIISYGNEAMGLILESKQIAAAFKELFALVERGQKLLPDYTTLPLLAKTLAISS